MEGRNDRVQANPIEVLSVEEHESKSVIVKEEQEEEEEGDECVVTDVYDAYEQTPVGSVLSEVRNRYVIQSKRDYDAMAKNIDNCQQYLKFGLCAEFSSCPYHHLRYENSPSIQIKNLFRSSVLDEVPIELPTVLKSIIKSTSAKVESGVEKRLMREYKKFYEDIVIKFRAAGPITMFKCCRNRASHLKGNVYIRYSNHEFATRAVNMYNGFNYNGRELEVELCSVVNWKITLCGLYEKDQTCPEEGSCSLIHAFCNPREEYLGRRIGRWDDHQLYPQIFKRLTKSRKKFEGLMGPKVEDLDLPKEEMEEGECVETYENLMNDPTYCRFFMKVGSCRFGDLCTRHHYMRKNTPTIVILNFFQHSFLDSPSFCDAAHESDLQIAYKEFYDDVIGKFRSVGEVVMFKGCRNYREHLKGNVYVQYDNHDTALEAVERFDGSFYNGRLLRVKLAPIVNWLAAVCGNWEDAGCSRHNCNFLHCFHNPGGEYQGRVAANQDPRAVFKESFKYKSKKHFEKNSRNDRYDKPPEQKERRKSKSLGVGRNVFNEPLDDDHDDRSRHRDRSRSQSRSRSRSGSKSRSHSNSRSHSRTRSRSRTRYSTSSKDKRKDGREVWRSEGYRSHIEEGI